MKYIEHLDTYSNRDKPLSFHWKTPDDTWLDTLGLPPARSDREKRARDAIITEAVTVGRAEPDRWISYSRRKAFYAGKRRYYGIDYAYSTVLAIIDALAAEGLLEHDKKRPGNRGWQSRFRATPALLATIEKPLPVIYEPLETVRLKDKDGHLVDYRDTAETERMRRFLSEYNEALAATNVELKAPGAVYDGNFIRCGEHTLYPDMKALWRMFSRGKFSLHGRFYGGWWQQVRKADRPFLEINGEAVAEPDYAQHHPTMLYAQAGKRLDGDAYALQDWERPLVKKAFLIIINADTYEAAVRAVMQEIGGQGARKKAERLITDIKHRHHVIEQYFHSGAGLRLMRKDSGMAEQVMKNMLLSRGVVVLPIHDSHVTPARYEGTVKEEMEAAFILAFPRVVSTGYGTMVPHMAGVVGFVLPLPAQGEFFPLPVSVPFHEVSSWGGGFLPPGIREGIIHEMKRQNLRQIDVASRIGLSRPQLTNALRGRFGVGTKAAAALKAFVLEEATPA